MTPRGSNETSLEVHIHQDCLQCCEKRNKQRATSLEQKTFKRCDDPDQMCEPCLGPGSKTQTAKDIPVTSREI